MADKKLNISLKEGGALGLISIFSSRRSFLNLIKSKIGINLSWGKAKNSLQKCFGTISPSNRAVNNIGMNVGVIKTKSTVFS